MTEHKSSHGAGKVYGFNVFISGRGQVRAIVRTSSRKKVGELCQKAGIGTISEGYLASYGAVTGNAVELAVANEPGVWVCKSGTLPTQASEYERLL